MSWTKQFSDIEVSTVHIDNIVKYTSSVHSDNYIAHVHTYLPSVFLKFNLLLSKIPCHVIQTGATFLKVTGNGTSPKNVKLRKYLGFNPYDECVNLVGPVSDYASVS